MTIERVGALVTAGKLAPTTLLAVISSLDWWAEHGGGDVGDVAREVMRSLPTDLDFRLYAALTDRADWQFVGQVPFDDWNSDGGWADAFVEELIAAFDTDGLCETLTDHLNVLEVAGGLCRYRCPSGGGNRERLRHLEPGPLSGCGHHPGSDNPAS